MYTLFVPMKRPSVLTELEFALFTLPVKVVAVVVPPIFNVVTVDGNKLMVAAVDVIWVLITGLVKVLFVSVPDDVKETRVSTVALEAGAGKVKSVSD